MVKKIVNQRENNEQKAMKTLQSGGPKTNDLFQ